MVALLASGAAADDAGICEGWLSLLQPSTKAAARTNGRIAKREITSIFSPSLAEFSFYAFIGEPASTGEPSLAVIACFASLLAS